MVDEPTESPIFGFTLETHSFEISLGLSEDKKTLFMQTMAKETRQKYHHEVTEAKMDGNLKFVYETVEQLFDAIKKDIELKGREAVLNVSQGGNLKFTTQILGKDKEFTFTTVPSKMEEDKSLMAYESSKALWREIAKLNQENKKMFEVIRAEC